METAVSAELDRFLEIQRQQTNALLHELADSLEHSGAVGAAMAYALRGDGKRLRPALCTAAYRAAGGVDDAAVQRLGAALEIVHTYSLIHDDLPCMDNDDVRRGRPTVHRKFDIATATLAGAALIPIAFRVADQSLARAVVDEERRRRLHEVLASCAGAGGMVGGQLMDLEAEANITSAADLERIHAAKTGALIQAACVIGGLVAQAEPAALAALEIFGRHLGLAFQITDDVLDQTASTAQLGKTAGKDSGNAKATYPALLGLEAASRRARQEANRAVQALRAAGMADGLLHELATFAIDRRR